MATVRVFRNLNRKGVVWSVQMRTAGAWRTVAHASGVAVTDAIFHASEKSRLRCIAADQREVHAWVQGTLSGISRYKSVAKWADGGSGIVDVLAAAATWEIFDLPRGVMYRPFVEGGFRLRATNEIITNAPRVVCTARGCSV